MISVNLEPDRATVSVVGEITEELAIELVDRVERLHAERFYTRIELEIASPGGAIVALDHCIDGMRRLREAGVEISTRALTLAASAAAILVSLGDRRAAMPRSLLQYHMGRVRGVQTVTADSASQIVEALHEVDRRLVALLVERARRSPESAARRGIVLAAGELRQSDWGVVAHLAGKVRGKGRSGGRKASLKKLRGKVSVALRNASDAKLTKLYATLFLLDVPISAALAKELRLIDSIGAVSDPVDSAEDGAGGIRVPEWKAIFPPSGRIPTAALCRHTLILGETGSGKTVSGILPAVSGILREQGAVGCALVIDPKAEILPVLKNLTEDPSEVRLIDVCRESNREVLNLMPGKLSVADDLAEGNVLAAARRILCRAASLTENNPAMTLAGKATTSRESYWDNEGARLAQTVLAFVLLVCEQRRTLFGTWKQGAALHGAPRAVRQALSELGERAGFLKRSEEIENAAADTSGGLGSKIAPEVVRTDFARTVRETDFYRRCKGFAEEFEGLKAACSEPRAAQEYDAATRELIDAVTLRLAPVPRTPVAPEGRARTERTRARGPRAAIAVRAEERRRREICCGGRGLAPADPNAQRGDRRRVGCDCRLLARDGRPGVRGTVHRGIRARTHAPAFMPLPTPCRHARCTSGASPVSGPRSTTTAVTSRSSTSPRASTQIVGERSTCSNRRSTAPRTRSSRRR